MHSKSFYYFIYHCCPKKKSRWKLDGNVYSSCPENFVFLCSSRNNYRQASERPLYHPTRRYQDWVLQLLHPKLPEIKPFNPISKSTMIGMILSPRVYISIRLCINLSGSSLLISNIFENFIFPSQFMMFSFTNVSAKSQRQIHLYSCLLFNIPG